MHTATEEGRELAGASRFSFIGPERKMEPDSPQGGARWTQGCLAKVNLLQSFFMVT